MVVTKDYNNLSSSSLLTLMAGNISVLNTHACTRAGQPFPFGRELFHETWHGRPVWPIEHK